MAITGFEHITFDLTKEEIELSEVILKQLKAKYNSKSNSITGPTIVKRMRDKGFDISESRLRKIINYLRQLSEPIIGSAHGYYRSTDREELIKQVISLEERAGAIMAASRGIRKYLNYQPITAEMQTKI